jgi:hypothetical protein
MLCGGLNRANINDFFCFCVADAFGGEDEVPKMIRTIPKIEIGLIALG